MGLFICLREGFEILFRAPENVLLVKDFWEKGAITERFWNLLLVNYFKRSLLRRDQRHQKKKYESTSFFMSNLQKFDYHVAIATIIRA